MIYLKQSLEIAAHQGARIAVIPNATNDNVIAQCTQTLADRKVRGAVVEISPDVDGADRGSIIEVSITVPCNANGLISAIFFRNRTLNGKVHMMKEL